MNAFVYKREAELHACEFVQLGYDRPEVRHIFRLLILRDHQTLEQILIDSRHDAGDLVGVVPSKRESMLRRMTKRFKHDPRAMGVSQMVLILGAWRHCRRAVRALEHLDEIGHFTPGNSYRFETKWSGQMLTRDNESAHAKWPRQWGKSPFPDEKHWVDSWEMPDYSEIMDDFKPKPPRIHASVHVAVPLPEMAC